MLLCACNSSVLSSGVSAHRALHANRYQKPTHRACPLQKLAMTCQAKSSNPDKPSNIHWHESTVSRTAKEQLLSQRGCLIWLTGLSGSGKSTVACALEHILLRSGHLTALLDGDNLRHGLNDNLGFSAEDRAENIRRVGEVGKLFVETGVICIAAFISPYAVDRDRIRARLQPGDFIEVYMKTPLEVCEERDPKGLYKLARAGKIKAFTGISDPYEPPLEPEVVLECRRQDEGCLAPEDMACVLLDYLQQGGYLASPSASPSAAAGPGGSAQSVSGMHAAGTSSLRLPERLAGKGKLDAGAPMHR